MCLNVFKIVFVSICLKIAGFANVSMEILPRGHRPRAAGPQSTGIAGRVIVIEKSSLDDIYMSISWIYIYIYQGMISL